MSGREVGHLSSEQIQVVQNFIERCIQLHMSKIETVSALSKDPNVAPAITDLVWQRLEEENRDFFQFYYVRLALKEQINRFNELLKKHAALGEQVQSTRAADMAVSDGSCMTQFQQSAGLYPIDQTCPGFDMSIQTRSMDFLAEALHGQSSNPLRLMQGLNGGIIKSENRHPSGSPIMFGTDTSIRESHPGLVEDASVASFSDMEASTQPMHDTQLGMNGSSSSFGQLGQIPKIFSFPDLSSFPHVLDNYQNSAFITTDADNFLDHGEIHDESKGAISRSYNTYEDFGSD